MRRVRGVFEGNRATIAYTGTTSVIPFDDQTSFPVHVESIDEITYDGFPMTYDDEALEWLKRTGILSEDERGLFTMAYGHELETLWVEPTPDQPPLLGEL